MLREIYFPELAGLSPTSARLPSAQPPTLSMGCMPVLKKNTILCEGVSRTVGIRKDRNRFRPEHTHIPDSGYASAEEYTNGGGHSEDDNDDDAEEHLALLRADGLERGFSIKWLTGLIKRADGWVNMPFEDANVAEENMRMAVIDEASMLLARFASDGANDGHQSGAALTRKLNFPFFTHVIGSTTNKQSGSEHTGEIQTFITVELNDVPLDGVDHTAVGLQSWTSAIVLAQRMCADPGKYLLANQVVTVPCTPRSIPKSKSLRVLELGSGTGLLSIAAAKVYSRLGCSAYVQATDYHPRVLDNLSKNMHANLGPIGRLDSEVKVDVVALDWAYPPSISNEEKYDIVLASDVIYEPQHACWIRDCAARTMKKGYTTLSREGDRAGISVFWLAIPLRSTGRHEGMGRTIQDAFSLWGKVEEGHRGRERLIIVSREEIGRQHKVGRADEGGYTLFEIRWADY